MRAIFKYPLTRRLNRFKMKTDRILSIAHQNGEIVAYAVHDDALEEKTYFFLKQGTGHPVEDVEKLNYIGTLEENIYMWHIFWEEETAFKKAFNDKEIYFVDDLFRDACENIDDDDNLKDFWDNPDDIWEGDLTLENDKEGHFDKDIDSHGNTWKNDGQLTGMRMMDVMNRKDTR